MPISLITGPANAGKAQLVMDAVRKHAAHGEEPLLVVPTEADQARYRRELADSGLVLGVRVERFAGLFSEVLLRARERRAALGGLARERILARLADVSPGMALELAHLIAELETQRVTPARLRGALRAWRGQRSAGDATALERVCELLERYQQTLESMRRADRELRVSAALDALRRKPSLWGRAPVLLYGFDDFTELQLDAIETLGGTVGTRLTVSLPYEPGRVAFAGRAGTFMRLAPLADSHTQLPARAAYYAPEARQALHHLERSLFSEEAGSVPCGGAVRLLEGGSPRAELELVAGEVRALLDAGMLAREIAIVHRSPRTIAALIEEVLSDCGVPYAMPRRTSFADGAIGRALLGLARCAGQHGSLADLIAWLGAPGVHAHAELVDRLEARALRVGALGAEQARALWETERFPLERIDRMRSAAQRGGVAFAKALLEELERLFCAPRRRAAALLGEEELVEAQALLMARRTLEELRELGRLAPELAPSPAELIDALERLELVHEPPGEASLVSVLDPLSLRARRMRVVFVCGLQEGVFPEPPRPHPLLSEEHRRELARAAGLVLRAEPEKLAAERYLLYALCSRPQERLTLSWHTADEDGVPVAPSLFLDDVCDLFDERLRAEPRRRFAGACHWPGPGAAAGRMARRPAHACSPSETRSPGAASDPAFGIGGGSPSGSIEPLRDERLLAELRERALWSASSLEAWAGCPVRWFVERLLRPAVLDPPAEPIARGGVAHAALALTLERLRERTGSARLSPATLPIAKRLLAEALEQLVEQEPLSSAPARIPGARRRLRADLERYLEHAAANESPLEPVHTELEFGFAEDGLAPFELGDGTYLRGRIDRIDLGAEGKAIVYDYKGRMAPPGARWVGDRALQVALYMLAVRRLLGHSVIGGFYQPLAGKDLRARGVFDGEGGVALDCVRTDVYEPEQLEELLERCASLALGAVAEARAGALEPRPDTCAFAGGCSYPTICRCPR